MRFGYMTLPLGPLFCGLFFLHIFEPHSRLAMENEWLVEEGWGLFLVCS